MSGDPSGFSMPHVSEEVFDDLHETGMIEDGCRWSTEAINFSCHVNEYQKKMVPPCITKEVLSEFGGTCLMNDGQWSLVAYKLVNLLELDI